MNKVAILAFLVGLNFTVNLSAMNFISAFFSTSVNQETIRGSGKQRKEDRPVRSFNEIHVAGLGLVILSQGDKNTLAIESDDNILPYLISEVSGNKLVIKPKSNINLQPTEQIKYYITSKDINNIELSGSISLQSEGIEADNLSMSTAGSSKVKAFIRAKLLKLRAEGSSDIELNGLTEKQNISLAGSVRYCAKNLASKLCTIKAAGSLKVELQVSDELEGSLSGAGQVIYAGNPNSVNVKTSGSAEVKKIS
jgi:Putative auto-transporter adhesin, head GIN domain